MSAKKDVHVAVPDLNIQHCSLTLVGLSRLVTHAWDEKAKKMMLAKQTKKATAGREVRRPYVEFANSLYWITPKPDLEGLTDEEAQDVINDAIPHAKFGFPAVAFKSAAVDAGYQQGVLDKKTTARGAFHIEDEFAIIDGVPNIREDMVRIGKGIAELRYRAEFPNWKTQLNISFNQNAISLEQIANLFNVGGYSNGVGEGRPSKGGSWGCFRVALGDE